MRAGLSGASTMLDAIAAHRLWAVWLSVTTQENQGPKALRSLVRRSAHLLLHQEVEAQQQRCPVVHRAWPGGRGQYPLGVRSALPESPATRPQPSPERCTFNPDKIQARSPEADNLPEVIMSSFLAPDFNLRDSGVNSCTPPLMHLGVGEGILQDSVLGWRGV